MAIRIKHNGYTVEITRINGEQIRNLIETVTGVHHGGFRDFPTCDVDRAARITGCDAGILGHYLGRLDYALEQIGAYLITDEMLACEQLAKDPRAEKIKVRAYWGFGAEFAREMTLAEVLRTHAGYRNAHQPDSGVAIAREPSDGGYERDPRGLVEIARLLLV